MFATLLRRRQPECRKWYVAGRNDRGCRLWARCALTPGHDRSCGAVTVV